MRKKKYRSKPSTPAYWQERRRTMHGLLLQAYRLMRRRCEGKFLGKEHLFKGLEYPTQKAFLLWALNDPGFILLFRQWKLSDYNTRLTPTVSRMDTGAGYTFDNMEFLTHSNNASLAVSTRWRVQELAMVRRMLNVDKKG